MAPSWHKPALPDFYVHYGVSDSVEGRFELIVLHLVLVLHRLGAVQAMDNGGIARHQRWIGAAARVRPRLGLDNFVRSAAIWTTTCGRWASAISPCRAGCADLARHSTVGKPPTSKRSARPTAGG